jgi:hypothetical protein
MTPAGVTPPKDGGIGSREFVLERPELEGEMINCSATIEELQAPILPIRSLP